MFTLNLQKTHVFLHLILFCHHHACNGTRDGNSPKILKHLDFENKIFFYYISDWMITIFYKRLYTTLLYLPCVTSSWFVNFNWFFINPFLFKIQGCSLHSSYIMQRNVFFALVTLTQLSGDFSSFPAFWVLFKFKVTSATKW